MRENSLVIQTRNLTRRFKSGQNELTVLDKVSFELNAGESLAIIGPSGSGKSTLLGLLAGLDSPSEGQVTILGKDLSQLQEEPLARFRGRHMGFIFQSYRLLPALTAEENVRVPLELAGKADAVDAARAWLARVGLEQRGGHRPVELSGGEQQRVALARALAPNPDLLLADEPTGNLDSKTGSAMMELIFSLVKQQGATLVLVTHELSLARRASRMLELQDGKIIRCEPD